MVKCRGLYPPPLAPQIQPNASKPDSTSQCKRIMTQSILQNIYFSVIKGKDLNTDSNGRAAVKAQQSAVCQGNTDDIHVLRFRKFARMIFIQALKYNYQM